MDDNDIDVAERDPSGRYTRSNEILGKGAFKTVYKAFDEVDGIEVAWNKVQIDEIIHSSEQRNRLDLEILLLKSLKHENIIKCFYSWVDDVNQTVNMITELLTSGSLRQYRKKHKKVELKAIKCWAMQVLRGLVHLHSHSPPIIHRDLKCDNIFVNGNAGKVKIGDLGLATVMEQSTAHSVIGTPEFMAPELYDENYDELVDIYSFGMCVLEMFTRQLPYGECNQPQIFKKVTSGIKPASLGKVSNPQVKQFIEKCIAPASIRPSASELLKDPFFALAKSEVAGISFTKLPSDNIPEPTHLPRLESHLMDVDNVGKNSAAFSQSSYELPPTTIQLSKSNNINLFSLMGKKEDESSVSMTLQIADKFGKVSENIQFIFFLSSDTTLSVAAEMLNDLKLPNDDVVLIAELMDDLIKKLAFTCKPSSDSSMGEAESLVLSQCNRDLNAQDYLPLEIPSGHAWSNGIEPCNVSSSALSDAFSRLSTSPTPIFLDNGNCDELMMELASIDSYYQQLVSELMKAKANAIENAKRKWIARKMTAT
ncbi:hypothetical protein V2J09_014591 [Rumex salicifolius]